MTDENNLPKPQDGKHLPQARFTTATWFIIAATLFGLFAVFILLYDAFMRL
jgi:hypothetical protein